MLLTPKSWAQMHDRIASDPALSATRHRILTLRLRHLSSRDHEVTHQTIANESGMSRRTVIRVTNWLVDNGYLVVTKRYDKNGYQAANEYQPGPVSLGVTPSPECHQSDTRVTRVSPQQRETTNPSSGLSSSEVPVVEEKEAVDLSTCVSAEVQSSSQGPENLTPTGITPMDPGVSLAVAAESGEHPHPPGAAHVLRVPLPDHMTAIEKVLDRLDRVQRNGTSTLASCPCPSHGKGNGDRNPSLSIAEKDGRVLIHCMSECNPQDVLISIGLDWPDLYDEPITNERGTKECEWTYQARDGSPWLTVERWQTPQGKRFVQRVPGSDRAGLPAEFKPCLFKLPKVLAAAKAGEEVFIVEGEKCVAAAEHLGVVATTAPAGVNGWRDYYTKWLEGCSQVTIICDNDETGMRYSAAVAASLRGAGIKVRTMKVAVAAPKADLYDHVLAGHTIADLVPVRLNQFRPEGRLANGLMKEIFPPVEWVIQDLMPIGFTVMGGAPKVGKSFITLDAALNVALGGEFLHTQRCVQGSVLMLSLDNDAMWRLQLRLKHLQLQYGVSLADANIEFHTDFPTGDAAIKAIEEWCADQREDGKRPLLVVADTLQKIEPNFDGSANRNSMNGGYAQAATNLSKWSDLALSQRIGVLATHHIRKSGDEDWMNRFIGSQGIAATATTLMMIDHQRGSKEASLLVSSRDAGEHIVTTKAGMRVIQGGKE
jgi:hypothetical protein